jgi:Uncharacterized protein conserved in bacteria
VVNGEFITNYPGYFILGVAIMSNLLAQLLKFLTYRILNNAWSFEVLFSTGGMPSSHTAFVVSALISVGITKGVDSAIFAVSFILTAVVVHDALGVRRHAGKQAHVLNNVVKDFLELTDFLQQDKKYDSVAYQQKLKEFLGHEPIEVIGGAVLGIIITVGSYLLLNNY